MPVRTEWAGHYLDGRTATRQPATARLLPSGVEIELAGGRRMSWPYGQVRQTQGAFPGEPVRLERGDGVSEALVVPDVAFLVALREVVPERAGRFHDPRRRRLRRALVALAPVAVVAVAAALYRWGIPALAALAIPLVPVAFEEQLGRMAIQHLAPAGACCTSPEGTRALDALLAALTRPLGPRPRYAFRVTVVDRPEVNALAAPGGQVVLFRGLVEEAPSPDALAGVLAHEVQHVLRRHATRLLVEHASTGLVIAALTGDVTGPVVYGAAAARTLGTLGYRRQHEREADLEGMRLLLAAGGDPAGLIRFFEGLTRARGRSPALAAYLSTHPSPEDRIARLRALAAAAPGPRTPLLSDADWRALRAVCAR